MSALTGCEAWQALERHAREMAAVQMRELFALDPERFGGFSITLDDLLLDYAKDRVTEETMRLLGALER